MKLIAQMPDGSRVMDTADFHSYSTALDAARRNIMNLGAVACYLEADSIPRRVVRTYLRATSPPPDYVEVIHGHHEYPAPPTLVPGVFWPSEEIVTPSWCWCKGGKLTVRETTDWRDMSEPSSFTAEEVTAMLERADLKGYNRGFKVGIAHRNKDRAAQLRRQADSLERTADAYALLPHQMGKIGALPRSVHAGVWGGDHGGPANY